MSLTKADIKKNVQENFKHIRKEFEMTGKQMGEKLKLNQKSYAAIEEGRALTPHHVYMMSQYTGISMDSLFKKRINFDSNDNAH